MFELLGRVFLVDRLRVPEIPAEFLPEFLPESMEKMQEQLPCFQYVEIVPVQEFRILPITQECKFRRNAGISLFLRNSCRNHRNHRNGWPQQEFRSAGILD